MNGSYRVILRFSLDGDYGSYVRNHFTNQLFKLGLRPCGTGTLESETPPTGAAAGLMQQIASVLNEMPQGVAIDHIWLYLDRRS